MLNLKPKRYTIWNAPLLIFQMVPVAALMQLLMKVFLGLQPTLLLLASAKFIDTSLAVAGGTAASSQIVLPIAAVVALMLLPILLNSLSTWLLLRSDQRRTLQVNLATFDKISRLHYRLIEDQETADLTNRVVNAVSRNLWQTYTSMLDAMSILLNVGGILLVLARQIWWAALCMLVLAVPLFWVAYKSGESSYRESRRNEKIYRRLWALSDSLTGRGAVEERTLFHFTPQVDQMWLDAADKAYSSELRESMHWWLRSQMGTVFTILVGGAMAAFLLRPTIQGAVTVGMFVSLSGACFNLSNALSWRLCGTISRFSELRAFYQDLTKFASLEEISGGDDDVAADLPDFESLEFRDVSFTYPGTEKTILSHVSFRLNRGGHYAIVGANGAGKTTITKLISGLYDNYEGEIFLNGQELRTIPYGVRKGLISTVAQDFTRYQLTLADNIRLGDLSMAGDDPRIKEAAQKAGLSDVIARLPLGLDNPLGKLEETSQDLSGGEWQRVAMARTIASRAAFYILDEPTAALDPLAESRLYDEFAGISEGKTTIFISHRLGSTRLADQVIVLDRGTVAECGSPDALLHAGGLYAEMFDAQRSWYI